MQPCSAQGQISFKKHLKRVAAFSKNVVCGHWVHSFEEDLADEFVYRPNSFDFPRSRGRKEFDLQPDGKFRNVSPGRADLPEQSSGDWNIEDESVVIHYDDGTEDRLKIKEVTPTKLVIRKS